MNKKVELVITILFGWMGTHKFMKGKFWTGVLYLFTAGLFCIGWFVDIYKCVKAQNEDFISKNNYDSLMGKEGIDSINAGFLLNIKDSGLNLKEDEICHYMDKAQTISEDKVTTGYVSQNTSHNLKVTSWLSYNTGDSIANAVRTTERIVHEGTLYITNRRILFSSNKESFDEIFDNIASIKEVSDGVVIHIDKVTYAIITKTHKEFMKVLKLLKNKKRNDEILDNVNN